MPPPMSSSSAMLCRARAGGAPPPRGNPDAPPRAMIIDAWFDNYVGVVMLVRVVDGELRKGEAFQPARVTAFLKQWAPDKPE